MRRSTVAKALPLLARMTLGLFVVLFGIVPPITVHADPITVLGTFNFLDVRSPNTAGLAIGSRNSFGLDVTPNPRTGDPMTSMSVTRTLSEFTPNPPLTLVYLDSPALPNQYALSFPCGTTNDPCGAEGLGPPPSWLQGPWRFTITNPNSPNSPVVVDTAPLGEVIAPPFVASMAIAPGPTPTQPRFSWTYPGTGIFDSVAIFIQNLDDRIAVGNSARIIHVDFGVPTSVNTYEVPQTLSGGGSLQAGVHYTVSIQLTRRRLDFSLWARSTAFFDFVLGGVETVPAAFLPTVGPDGVYHFNVSEVGPGQVIFIDPQVAIGYDYAIGVGDPNFASVVLPEGIGDEQYGVYLFNARGRAYKVADVAGGVPFAFDAVGFPNGVDRFRVLGIEAAAGLDPRNVTAFVTGVSFVDGGPFTGTMTPLTRRVATSIGECQGVVATLRAQIEAAGFTGTNSERFRTRLIGELDQTAADLDNGQAGRAIRDLRQFKGQATGLVASRRLNDADGNELLSGVADAIDCTSHLANSP